MQSRRMYREPSGSSRSTNLNYLLKLAALFLLALGAVSAAQASPAAKTVTPAVNNSNASPDAKRQAAHLYAKGARIEERDLNPRQAIDLFDHAAALDPQNELYKAAATLAREHLVTQLIRSAEDARKAGNLQGVRDLYQEAIEVDPKNPVAAQHYEELLRMNQPRPSQLPARGAQHIGTEMVFLPMPGRHDFHLKMMRRDMVMKVYSAYGINSQCDDSVAPKPGRFDIDNADFETAARALRLATHTFAVPLDPLHALFADDIKASHEKYDREETETFFLSGLTTPELTDVENMVKNVYEIKTASVLADKGTLTVRAPQSVMNALRSTIYELIQGRDQVQLEVRLFEINKTKERNTGIDLPQTINIYNFATEANQLIKQNQSIVDQIITAGLANPGDTGAILALLLAGGYLNSTIGSGFATFGGGKTLSAVTFGTATGHLALNSSSVRTLDQMQLRMADQEVGSIRSGTRYPITTSKFSSGANVSLPTIPGLNSSGSLSQLASQYGINLNGLTTAAAVPQVEYQDLGLSLKATPHVLRSGDIELNIDLQIQALAGAAVNDVPVLANRHYTTVTTLKTGETTLLLSNLTRQEQKSINGEPGVGDIPGLNMITTDRDTTYDVSTLVIVMTPTLIRSTHHGAVGAMVVLPQQTGSK